MNSYRGAGTHKNKVERRSSSAEDDDDDDDLGVYCIAKGTAIRVS